LTGPLPACLTGLMSRLADLAACDLFRLHARQIETPIGQLGRRLFYRLPRPGSYSASFARRKDRPTSIGKANALEYAVNFGVKVETNGLFLANCFVELFPESFSLAYKKSTGLD